VIEYRQSSRNRLGRRSSRALAGAFLELRKRVRDSIFIYRHAATLSGFGDAIASPSGGNRGLSRRRPYAGKKSCAECPLLNRRPHTAMRRRF
jgi:hypothetical protein